MWDRAGLCAEMIRDEELTGFVSPDFVFAPSWPDTNFAAPTGGPAGSGTHP